MPTAFAVLSFLVLVPAELPAASTPIEPAASDVNTAAQEATAASSGSGFQRIDERTPRGGTPLIANKLYPMAGRFELGLNFDASFGDKYVDHIGGHAAAGFHFFDSLALEAFGGYVVGDETGIVSNVRNQGKSFDRLQRGLPCANPGCEPQLPDMWQTTWFAGADVQWAPIYGKVSAVAEYDINFQLYLRGGGGVEGIQRLLSNGSISEPGIRPSVNYGLGVRLIPWKYIALRAELVSTLGLNPNVEEHETEDETSCTDGYVIRSGNKSNCLTDFSQSTMFQLGVSFLL
jgi:outer membrane beta-barrel protein